MSDKTYTVIIGVVTTVWAVNIGFGMLALNGYQPSESINGIFMAIVGGAFLARTRKRGDDDQ